MKYNELNLGQVEAIVNKLGGMDGVKRFLSGELVVSKATRVWKTWRTLKLGTGPKTADDFRKALKKAGCNIGDWGNYILGNPDFTVSPEAKEVELVVVSVAELGFEKGATRKDIYKRAQELGFDLCPAEVGPQLCLQYKDQPKDEWLIIAFESISSSNGHIDVFRVMRDGDGVRWLDGDDGNPGNLWNAGTCWVFLRRK